MENYELIARGPFSNCRYVLNSREIAAGRARRATFCDAPTVDGVACQKHIGTTWQDHTVPKSPVYGSRPVNNDGE